MKLFLFTHQCQYLYSNCHFIRHSVQLNGDQSHESFHRSTLCPPCNCLCVMCSGMFLSGCLHSKPLLFLFNNRILVHREYGKVGASRNQYLQQQPVSNITGFFWSNPEYAELCLANFDSTILISTKLGNDSWIVLGVATMFQQPNW